MRGHFLVAMLCLAPAGSAAPPAFKVLKAEFGVVSPAGFRPATKVPLKGGQGFGWVIQLDIQRDSVKWREEIRLPAAPGSWRVEDTEARHTLSADRRTSVLERESRLEGGVVYNFWQLEPGDPRGRYTMRVMIEGLLVSIFEFDVE
jgi:hypothetical protein